MDPSIVAEKLAISLGLGLLVGLQRERIKSPLAGIRTFALITLFGSLCALLSQAFDGWVVGLGAVAVAGMLVVGNLVQGKASEVEAGVTTEIAALVMYGVGAYVVVGEAGLAVAAGGAVALLLHWKAPLHEFVDTIGETDVTAIMRFVMVALVIYPVLPDTTFDYYEVLNPKRIWFMVVLIVAIGIAAYVGYKLFGQRPGTILAGVLGGMISSTATTVSYSRSSRESPGTETLAALVIVIASAISYARVLIEIAVVAPGSFWLLAPPLAIQFGVMAALVAALFFFATGDQAHPLPQPNPAELKTAIVFAGLYAGVVFAVAAARDWFGPGALYGVAIVSGLHDVDAITLSTAELVEHGQGALTESGAEEAIGPSLGWRLILTATLANMVVKGLIASILGGPRLFARIVLPFGIAILSGVALLLLGDMF